MRKTWDRSPPPPSPGLSSFRLAQGIFGSRHYTWHSPNGMIQNLHIMSVAIFGRPPPRPGRSHFPRPAVRRLPLKLWFEERREKRERGEGREKPGWYTARRHRRPQGFEVLGWLKALHMAFPQWHDPKPAHYVCCHFLPPTTAPRALPIFRRSPPAALLPSLGSKREERSERGEKEESNLGGTSPLPPPFPGL